MSVTTDLPATASSPTTQPNTDAAVTLESRRWWSPRRLVRGRLEDPAGRGPRCSPCSSAPPCSTCGASALRLGERVLLRRGPGRDRKLEGVLLRLARRGELHHRRQAAGLAVGDGRCRRGSSASTLEHPRAAGARGRRRRRPAVRDRAPLVRPGGRALAGAVLALTPVAALMFRFNNPDALLVLLLVGRGLRHRSAPSRAASTRWLVAGRRARRASASSPRCCRRSSSCRRSRSSTSSPRRPRCGAGIWQLCSPASRCSSSSPAGGSRSWSCGPASAARTSAARRPTACWSSIFGYNGFGRLTGNETGSVGGGGGAGGGGMWGATGMDADVQRRLGRPDRLAAAGRARPARRRPALVTPARAAHRPHARRRCSCGAAGCSSPRPCSASAQGIIHPYYTVALAPAIGALVGIGAVALCGRRAAARRAPDAGRRPSRRPRSGRSCCSTAAPSWQPWLRLGRSRGRAWRLLLAWSRRSRLAATRRGGAGRRRYRARPGRTGGRTRSHTATTPHTGVDPAAGPDGGRRTSAAGGRRRRRTSPAALRRALGSRRRHGRHRQRVAPSRPASASADGQASGTPEAFGGQAGRRAVGPGGGAAAVSSTRARPVPRWSTSCRPTPTTTRGSRPPSAPTRRPAYQLATGDPVMAIGGFNGSDPYPTLAEFQALRARRQGPLLHRRRRGRRRLCGRKHSMSEITSWVKSAYSTRTVDGTTLYDLSSPKTTAAK